MDGAGRKRGCGDHVGYRIEASTDGGANFTAVVQRTRTALPRRTPTPGCRRAPTRHYRVSAINGFETSMPSSTDSATTAANSVPTFSPSTSTRTVAENTASGTNLGGLVTASDSDTEDTLTYSLRGTDGGSFAVVTSSGQLRTSAALDHESKASYSVTVRVDDGDGGTADASVTISVTDVDEPPRRPAAPSVGAVSGSTTSLDVSWSAPENAGRPAIASYDVQYRKQGVTNWTNGPQNVTATSARLPGLDAGTAYNVQVRASNDEGDSLYSQPGSGSTNAADTTPPVLSSATVNAAASRITLIFNENIASPGLVNTFFSVTTDGVAVATTGTGYNGGRPSNMTVSLTAGVIEQGAAVVVTYTDPTAGNDGTAVQDTAGNDAASFTTGVGGVPAVVNNSTVPDTRAPRLTAASVNAAGTQITLAFSENLSTSVPAASVFSAFMGGESLTIGSVTQPTGNLNQIVLAVTPTIPRDGPVSVTYAKPSSGNTIQDAAGNETASFTTGLGVPAVTNNSTQSGAVPPTNVVAAPVPGSTTSLSVSWSAVTGAVTYDVRYRVSFSFDVDPEWTMETGVTTTSKEIGGIAENRGHLIQVRAVAAGMTAGPWSASAYGLTNPSAEEVLANFPLVPAGLGPGDSFRVLFLTSSKNVTLAYGGAGDYHTSAQSELVDGLDTLFAGGEWNTGVRQRAVVSTPGVSARLHTDTTWTETDRGVPIYWISGFKTGAKVADDYADFYDGDWDDEANPSDGYGSAVVVSSDNQPWTGSANDGTELMEGGVSRALGQPLVGIGGLNSSTTGVGPLGGGTAANTGERPLYGLSQVYRILDLYRLVSNLAVSDDPEVEQSAARLAQAFTTGTNAGGYGLQKLIPDNLDGDAFSAAIYTVDASGHPDTLHAALSSPATFGSEAEFTAPVGTTLEPETTYAAVFTPDTAGTTMSIYGAAGDGENLRVRPGWSVADAFLAESGSSWSADAEGVSLTIEVVGTELEDTTPPMLESAEVDSTGTDITLTFDEEFVYPPEDPGNFNFRVDVQLRFGINVGDASLDSEGFGVGPKTVTLRVTTGSIPQGQTVTVTYLDPTDYDVPGLLEDAAGNDVASFTTGSGSVPAVVNNSTVVLTTGPGMPTGLSATASGKTRINLSWTAPSDGGSAITGYLIEASTDGGANFTTLEANTNSTATTHSHTGLPSGAARHYRVSAINAFGTGMPSSTDSATTAANSVPTFSPSTSTRTVAENTASGTNLGGPVTASDSDTEDTLTYSLRGTDGGSFAVVASSGQLRTSAALDHESKASYSVTVRVDDGDGGTADASVTISVTDVDEPPRRPAAPSVGAVSGSTTSLDVSWSAPENAGRPAIASYDVQYRKQGVTNWTNGPQNVTATSARLPGLDAGTAYNVQVRASNDEGDSLYSQPGSGSTNAADNDAPVFNPSSVTLTLAENTVVVVNVGSPVMATDADGDTLTYSLGGTDASSFTIVETSGQIRTVAGATYDYESKPSYSVTVTARDGDGATASASVTISVTDVAEPPRRPAPPSVGAVSGSTTSLDVSWSAPENAGRPAIASYDVQYRKQGVTNWTNGPQNVTATATSARLSSLDAGTAYNVQVRASNDEGDSPYSQPGSGSTNAADNDAPVFDPSSVTLTLAENTVGVVNVGNMVTATDADGDTLTYSLGGTDASSFTIVETNGQIRTVAGATYDYESKPSLSVTVTARDGDGATASASVTISVTDVAEPPRRPAAPVVRSVSGSTTSLDVSWSAPENAGRPAIASYDVQYRKQGTTNWTNGPQNVTVTSARLDSLDTGTAYDVQVRGVERRGRQPVFAARHRQHEHGGQQRAGVRPRFGDVDAGREHGRRRERGQSGDGDRRGWGTP